MIVDDGIAMYEVECDGNVRRIYTVCRQKAEQMTTRELANDVAVAPRFADCIPIFKIRLVTIIYRTYETFCLRVRSCASASHRICPKHSESRRCFDVAARLSKHCARKKFAHTDNVVTHSLAGR
jgi:hypothetical protein